MEKLRELNQLFEEITSERKPQIGQVKKLSTTRIVLQCAAKTWLKYSLNIALRVILVYFKIRRQGSVRPLPAVCVISLSSEQLFSGKSKQDLVEFFKEERFGNLKGEILIETKSPQACLYNFKSYKTSIPIDLLFNRLTLAQKKKVLDLSSYLIDLYYESLDRRASTSLGTIYALFELTVWFVIREERITLITTQSSITRLPVAFKIQNSNFDRKLLWYSTNSQPIVKRLSLVGKCDFSKDLSDNVDMHYVWDVDSKKFLKLNGISRVSVVGSILFVKPETVNIQKQGFNLIYFDVTPHEITNTYYTVERMCTNLCALIEIVESLSMETKETIKLLVKPKRKIKKTHSKKYINLLTSFENEGRIQLIKPGTNLYGLIGNSDSVIGIPFTSPVVVGRELGIPSAFMDVHEDDFLVPGTQNGFPVLTDQSLVSSWLRERLHGKPSNQ